MLFRPLGLAVLCLLGIGRAFEFGNLGAPGTLGIRARHGNALRREQPFSRSVRVNCLAIALAPDDIRQHVRLARRATVLQASAREEKERREEDDGKLPPAVLPICLGVFVQMLGEGIAISSIPLHLKSFGATAMQVGLATSAFSVAQMILCPFIVKLSSRIGRTTVLRICLAGATAASFVITLSSTINGVIFGRFLAGVFAASVPVAQAGVTDLVPSNQSALALSRVASANQMGIVVGPAMAALLAYAFGECGVPAHLQMRAVFLVSGLFAAAVLAIDKLQAPLTPASVEQLEQQSKVSKVAQILRVSAM
jgi:predicted MFS family arabinose efflux permease